MFIYIYCGKDFIRLVNMYNNSIILSQLTDALSVFGSTSVDILFSATCYNEPMPGIQ